MIEIQEGRADVILKWSVPLLALLALMVGGYQFLSQWRQTEASHVADEFNTAASELSSKEPEAKLGTIIKLEIIANQDPKYVDLVRALLSDYLTREFALDRSKAIDCPSARAHQESAVRISNSQAAADYLHAQNDELLDGVRLSSVVLKETARNIADDRPEFFTTGLTLSKVRGFDLDLYGNVNLECGRYQRGRFQSYTGIADGVLFQGVNIQEFRQINNSQIEDSEIGTDGSIHKTEIYNSTVIKENDSFYGETSGWIRESSVEVSLLRFRNRSGIADSMIKDSTTVVSADGQVRRSRLTGGLICGSDLKRLLAFGNTFDPNDPPEVFRSCDGDLKSR